MNVPTSLLVDILKGVAGTAALFFAYLHLPLVGMAAGVFAAFPAIYFGLKHGRSVAIIIVALSALVFLPLPTGVNIALFFLMQCGLLAASLTWLLVAGKSGGRALVYAVALNLVVAVAVTIAFAVSQGSDPHALILKEIDRSVGQWLALSEKTGMKGEELQLLRDGMLQAKSLLAEIYPALVMVWVALVAGMNLLLVSMVAPRLPVTLNLGRFSQYRNPEPLVWVLILAGFGLLVPQASVQQVALNILIVICAGYFVQGLAVLSGIFNRFAVPPLLRNVLYLFLLLQPYLLAAIVVFGIFDIWGDFRTPKQPNKPVE